MNADADAVRVRIQRLRGALPLPTYETPGAAGMDLRAEIDAAIVLDVGERVRVPTGIAIGLPHGFEAQVRPRSGLALKAGVTVLNAPGTIDEDYRGEISVVLINHGRQHFVIEPGARIAQLVVAPVTRATWELVDSLDVTTRGGGGYGSTGA